MIRLYWSIKCPRHKTITFTMHAFLELVTEMVLVVKERKRNNREYNPMTYHKYFRLNVKALLLYPYKHLILQGTYLVQYINNLRFDKRSHLYMHLQSQMKASIHQSELTTIEKEQIILQLIKTTGNKKDAHDECPTRSPFTRKKNIPSDCMLVLQEIFCPSEIQKKK